MACHTVKLVYNGMHALLLSVWAQTTALASDVLLRLKAKGAV